MSGRQPKIKWVKEWEWDEYDTGVVHFEQCCDCNLRHLIEYKIIKRQGKEIVGRRVERDEWGTWASRKLEKE